MGFRKTVFLKLCEQRLKQAGLGGPRVIQFNAWREGYLKNPLLDLTYCISAAIRTHSTRSLRRHARVAARQIILSVNAAVTSKTWGIVNVRTLFGNNNPWITAQRHILDFQKDLEEVARKHKLVLLIDELDQCEPLYALQVMDQVHHVFEVPNVKVVLAINQHALEQSIQQMYGSDYDAGRYIRRFIHEALQLPNPPTRSIAAFIKKRITASSSTNAAYLEEMWDPYRIFTVAISSPGRNVRDADIAVRIMQDILADLVNQHAGRRENLEHLSLEQFAAFASMLIALRLISPGSYKLLVQQPSSGLQVWHDLQDHLDGWFGYTHTDSEMMNYLWILCAHLIALGGTGATNGVPTVDRSALDATRTRSPFREEEHAELKSEVVKLRTGSVNAGLSAGSIPHMIKLPIRRWSSIIDRGMPLTQG